MALFDRFCYYVKLLCACYQAVCKSLSTPETGQNVANPARTLMPSPLKVELLLLPLFDWV